MRSVWILAVLLLVSAGISYRVLATKMELFAVTIPLPVSLEKFPTQVGEWAGRDVPIADNVLRVAANDAYLNRLYVNDLSNEWVNIYIAYTARPRTMVGHRPQECYPAGGWILDSTGKVEIALRFGVQVPCLIHRFHKPSLNYEEILVLNFYIVNGQLTSDESVFSGVGWRTPNIAGDPAKYVAQVQISSVLEHPIQLAVQDFTEKILDYFPDENGEVRAKGNIEPAEVVSD